MPKSLQPGVINGYWFFFDIADHPVTVHASGWSARERLWINDDLVSDRRSFRVATLHEIEVGGERFEIRVEISDWLRGGIRCTVQQNEQPVHTVVLKMIPDEQSIWRYMFKDLWKYFLGGAAVGFVVALVYVLLLRSEPICI